MARVPDIPPHARALYEAAGPVIRHRILRDVLGYDESFIHVAQLAQDIACLPEARALIAAQRPDGTWGGLFADATREGTELTTEWAVLRLCELGLEQHEAVQRCVHTVLEPLLCDPGAALKSASPEMQQEQPLARRVVRDKVLHLLCCCTRGSDLSAKPFLETVLAEWGLYLSEAGCADMAPTAESYAAVCRFPWDEDDFPRVRELVQRLVMRTERELDEPPTLPPILAPHRFHLHEKWEYLARPDLLFYELELAARLGVARDLPVTQWLLEELEARQDADGRIRFDTTEPIPPSWYYPLEPEAADPSVEWTVRALQIFALLGFDM